MRIFTAEKLDLQAFFFLLSFIELKTETELFVNSSTSDQQILHRCQCNNCPLNNRENPVGTVVSGGDVNSPVRQSEQSLNPVVVSVTPDSPDQLVIR